jgi:hypothetical protein
MTESPIEEIADVAQFEEWLAVAPAGGRCAYFRGPRVDSSQPGIAHAAMSACDHGDVYLIRRKIDDRNYEFIAERCRREGIGKSLAAAKRIIDRGEQRSREYSKRSKSAAQASSDYGIEGRTSRLTTAKDAAEKVFRPPDAQPDS